MNQPNQIPNPSFLAPPQNTNRTKSYGKSLELLGDLPPRMVDRFRSECPLPELKNTPSTTTEIVVAYNASIDRLQMLRAEANEFLRHVYLQQYSIQQRASSHLRDIEKTIQAKGREINLPPIPISQQLRSEFFEETPQKALAFLQSELHSATEHLIGNFFGALENLAEQQVIGRIDFTVADGCRFRYFEHRISEQVQSFVTDDVTTRTTVTKGEILQERTTHEQHLTGIRVQPLTRYEALIPSRVRVLLDCTPIWLHEEIEIVEGDLFRHDHAKESTTTTWQEETTTILSFKNDPAAVLGPYVLAAWLVEESEEEIQQAKRERIDRQRASRTQNHFAKSELSTFLGAALFTQFLALMLHLAGLYAGRFWHVAGFFLSLSGLIPLTSALPLLAVASATRATWAWRVQACVLGGVILLIWQLLFLSIAYGLVGVFLATISLFVACLYFGCRFLKQVLA